MARATEPRLRRELGRTPAFENSVKMSLFLRQAQDTKKLNRSAGSIQSPWHNLIEGSIFRQALAFMSGSRRIDSPSKYEMDIAS